MTRADAPKVLEYNWGDFDMRWKLEAFGGGTRLTLWTNIGHRFIAIGAAGWHICFDVLDHLLSGTSIDRIVGPEAMKFGGWQRLNAEYAKQFGIETPNWPPQAAQKSCIEVEEARMRSRRSIELKFVMKDATKRSIFRWIHIVFSIPINFCA